MTLIVFHPFFAFLEVVYEKHKEQLTGVSKNVDGRDITNGYTYENDKIKTITHNGFSYSFDYDSLGNNIAVNIGSQNLIKNNYDLPTGNLL